MEGVQSESTPSSSLEEKFVISNDNPSYVPRERLQTQQMEWPQD
jgi:hypothetical protein